MRTVILICLSISMTSCFMDSETQYALGEDASYLYVGSDITEVELAQIAKEFKALKNIDIDYSDTEFSSNGKLKFLSLDVNCNDGFSGGLNNAARILRVSRTGFIRNYKDESSPWAIGTTL